MPKFLCVCEGGNVRSHALAYILHDRFGMEALAIGWARVSRDTLDHFCAWADVVVLMQSEFAEKISKQFASKVCVVDVGPDRWGPHVPKDLKELIYPYVRAWQDAGWTPEAFK